MDWAIIILIPAVIWLAFSQSTLREENSELNRKRKVASVERDTLKRIVQLGFGEKKYKQLHDKAYQTSQRHNIMRPVYELEMELYRAEERGDKKAAAEINQRLEDERVLVQKAPKLEDRIHAPHDD